MHCPKLDNKASASIHGKCSLVSNQFINCGSATDMGLPMYLFLQTKGDLTSSWNTKGNTTNDFVYKGCNYMCGDFVAFVDANLKIITLEDYRSEGHVSDLRI
jgi:hypothetical protein